MSCSQGGMMTSSFMRSRMDSRTALKLFSLGLRLEREETSARMSGRHEETCVRTTLKLLCLGLRPHKGGR